MLFKLLEHVPTILYMIKVYENVGTKICIVGLTLVGPYVFVNNDNKIKILTLFLSFPLI